MRDDTIMFIILSLIYMALIWLFVNVMWIMDLENEKTPTHPTEQTQCLQNK